MRPLKRSILHWSTGDTVTRVDGDAMIGTATIERMGSAGLLVRLGEAVGEGAIVVGQQLDDAKRGTGANCVEKSTGGLLRLVRMQFQEGPARGAIDGDEQVAPTPLLGYLRQIFDVDVDGCGRIVLEGLGDQGLAGRSQVH